MEKDAATVYCPNELCQAANPATNRFCQQCSTPIPQHYLWAVGEGKTVGNPGEILGDRYYVINQFILLDSKPGLLPQVPDLDHLQPIRPYLRLFPYRLHVPQVYGVLPLKSESDEHRQVILLEKPPLDISDGVEVRLCPSLDIAWGQASSMRQLNWLWQMAQLWQPLASESVASSLLDPLLLRTNGSILRILELRSDGEHPPQLSALGEFWRVHLLHKCQSAIAEFVSAICNSLITAKIHSGEQLVAALDKGLLEIGRHQANTVTIITQTDTGPQRQRNEDACYPPGGSRVSKPPQASALAIVCDGIGGHEGGNVASNLAIETIHSQVQQLTDIRYDHIDSTMLLADLENAAAIANDKISQRNDSEQRSGRQRMGTTLVMALAIAHEMYITHVGDSRAYLITPQGCYQVTIDDDVASREVRLGYAVYRDAVSQPASGSLVQALGMGSSNSLHPTAQRFIVDEDCVFLLCSDGLSDYDRIEQNWQTEILPILNENRDIGNVITKLVEIANTQNGHDNVTIAIVSSQVNYAEPTETISPELVELATTAPIEYKPAYRTANFDTTPNQRTQVLPDTVPTKSTKLPLHLIILSSLVVIGAAIGYLLSSSHFKQASQPAGQTNPSNLDTTTNPSPVTAPPVSNQNLLDDIVRGDLITTQADLKFNQQPTSIETPIPIPITVPKGTTLQVVDTKAQPAPEAVERNYILDLRVCQIPENTIVTPSEPSIPLAPIQPDPNSLKPGNKVSIATKQLTPQNVSVSRPRINPANSCTQLPKVEGETGNEGVSEGVIQGETAN